jgi:murein DD-endopeptidase MepM/ murein hydrolase activator NlpD
LLLALLEYRAEALSSPERPENVDQHLLGQRRDFYENLYYQLLWLADTLNNGYYQWLDGKLLSHDLLGGELERYDPWQNAATVSLQEYFASILPNEAYYRAIAHDGFTLTYQKLFGDIWFPNRESVMEGSLVQPDLTLPFVLGKSWSYTGGPHPVWGEKNPWAAIDFAPPSDMSGCAASGEWATAVGDGVIVRAEPGLAILDLDGDGDERTGWNILYLHLSSSEAAPQGKQVSAGDVIGHPSCERGRATGTHIHVARKYNGQWVPADGVIPFTMEGWVTHSTGIAYQGSLTRHSQVVTACTCSDQFSQITAQK